MSSLPAPLQPPPSQSSTGKRPRKQRQPISCTECRQRKLKCDRHIPGCSACIKRKLPLDRCKFGDERDQETPEQRAARLHRLQDAERRRAQRKAAKAFRTGEAPASEGNHPPPGATHPPNDDDDDDSDDSQDDDDDEADEHGRQIELADSTEHPPQLKRARIDTDSPRQLPAPVSMPLGFGSLPPSLPTNGSTPSAAAHAQLAVHARNQAARIQAQAQARAQAHAQAQLQQAHASQLAAAAAAAAAIQQFPQYSHPGTNQPYNSNRYSVSPQTDAAAPPQQANGLHALITALGSSDSALNGLPPSPSTHSAAPPGSGLSAAGSPAPGGPQSSTGPSPHYMYNEAPRSQSHHRPSSPRRAGLPAYAIVAEADQLRRANSLSRLHTARGASSRPPGRPWRNGNEHTTELLDTLGNQDTTSAVLGLQRLYCAGRQESSTRSESQVRGDPVDAQHTSRVRLQSSERDGGLGEDGDPQRESRQHRSASSPVYASRLHRFSLPTLGPNTSEEQARGRTRERPLSRGSDTPMPSFDQPDSKVHNRSQVKREGSNDPALDSSESTSQAPAESAAEGPTLPPAQQDDAGQQLTTEWPRTESELHRTQTPAPSAASSHAGSASATPGPSAGQGIFPGIGLGGLGMGSGDGQSNAKALLAIGEKVLQKSSMNEAKAQTRALALLPGKPQTVHLINMYLEELGMITPFVRVDFVMKELDLLYESIAEYIGSNNANVLPTIVEDGPGGMMRQRLVETNDPDPSSPRPRPATVVQPVVGTGPGAGGPQPRLTFLAYVLFALSAIVELLPSTMIISLNLVRSSEQIHTLLHDWLDTALECLEANELGAHPSLEGVQASLVAIITLAHRFRHEDLLKLLDGGMRAARRLGLDRLGSTADTPVFPAGQSPSSVGHGTSEERGVGAAPGPAPRPDLDASLDKSQRKLSHWWVDPDVQMSMDNLEIGRAVWTALAMTDWSHSGLNGSYSIRPFSYTTCPPYAPAPQENSRRGMPSPHDAWLGLLEAADVARQVQELTSQAEVLGQEVDYQEVLALDAKLHDVLAQRAWTWRETDLTFGQEELANNLDIKRLQKQASLIRATVYYRTLKLHRPFMSKGYRYPDQSFVASVPRALDSARQLVIEARLMSANDWISRRDRIQRYYLFQACLAMITDLWYRPRTFYPLFQPSSGAASTDSTHLSAPPSGEVLRTARDKSSAGTGEDATPKMLTELGSTEPSVIGFDSPEETREMEDNLTWIIDRLKDEGQAIKGSVLHGVSKNLERLMAATVQRGLQQQMLRSQHQPSPMPPHAQVPRDAATPRPSEGDPTEPVPPAINTDQDHLTDTTSTLEPSSAALPPAPAPSATTAPPPAIDNSLTLPPHGTDDDEMVQMMDARLSRLAEMTPQTWTTQLGGLGGLGALSALGGLVGPQNGLDSNQLGNMSTLGALSQLSLGVLTGGLNIHWLQALQQLQQQGALSGVPGLQQNLQQLASLGLLGAADNNAGAQPTTQPSTSASVAPSSMGATTPSAAPPLNAWSTATAAASAPAPAPASVPASVSAPALASAPAAPTPAPAPTSTPTPTPDPNHSLAPEPSADQSHDFMSYFLPNGAPNPAPTSSGNVSNPSLSAVPHPPFLSQASPALAPAPGTTAPSSGAGASGQAPFAALDSTNPSMFQSWERAWTDLFDTLEGDATSVAGASSLSSNRAEMI